MRVLLARRPWIPWAVVVGCLVVIGYLGAALAQARTHHQETRRMVANTLWFNVDAVTRNVQIAERSLAEGDVENAIRYLNKSDTQFGMIAHSLDTYRVLTGPTLGHEATIVGDTLHFYQFEPNRLWTTLERAKAPPPADLLAEVTALRMDLERWQATFTEDLLRTGSREHLTAAARLFCQDLQLPDMQDLTCHF